jgi:excisionase family DNA binding protein
MPEEQPEYYTVEEVAKKLRIDRQAVWNLIRRRQLAAFKIGGVYRITPGDLQDYLRRQRIEPDKP